MKDQGTIDNLVKRPYKGSLWPIWKDPKKLEIVTHWCREGASLAELAANMGMSVPTLHNWRSEHPEFLKAMNDGIVFANTEIEHALHKRAYGYDYEEQIIDKDGSIKTIKKHLAPDPTALKYFLTCRDPKKWSEKQIVDVNVTHDTEVNQLTAIQTASEVVNILLGLKKEGVENGTGHDGIEENNAE